MTQKDTVDKIFNDLISSYSVPSYTEEVIKQALQMAHGVGYDMGRHYRRQSHMRLISYDKKGNRIAVYRSVSEAARHIKCARSTLYKAVRKRTFSKGYYWATEQVEYDK